ncbi:DEAD/DEAH box helicase, partial [Candidatus Liberibacter sp.]|uniref:DEAD/DEAH box helicase n=1 Tax=Candidatus Liberibacter sp. TaxID=34022 RepID=UPI0015F4F7E4
AGKTIMFSAVLGRFIERGDVKKACVIAHRDELTNQNESKFNLVNPNVKTSVFNSSVKNWNSQVCFGMVQTLARNIQKMPTMDMLVIDEAHHANATSYQTIVKYAKKKNPHCMIFGMTATPNRGDGNGLKDVFTNIADQITVKELIYSGHLVRPVPFIMDVGIKKELATVRKVGSDFDMDHVEKIMNTRPINNAVIKHWKEKAGDRKTVIFCSQLDHASNVTEAFQEAGISAGMVSGSMSKNERQNVLSDFENNKIQVIVNVAVLTEGWDYPPVNCVVLLRPCSQRSIMTQMIGRGLRIVDPETYPDVIKTDCIVLDFGASLMKHGFMDQKAKLEGRDKINFMDNEEEEEEEQEQEQEEKEKEKEEKDVIADFSMKEFEILKTSPFEWLDLGNDILTATGFEAWSCITFRNGHWHAIGGSKGRVVKRLLVGEKANCLAMANDWLNAKELYDSAHKTKSWLKAPATAKQLAILPPEYKRDFGLTRYKASALITLYKHSNKVKEILGMQNA